MDYVVAIDLGGTNIKGGIVSGDGEVILDRSIKTHARRGPEKVVKAMGTLAKELIEESGKPIEKGGVGSPGPLSQMKGEVYSSPNLPNWECVAVSAGLEEIAGIPFTLENDANAACLGEKLFGAGRPFDPIVHLTLGTGVGGGLYLNGGLFRGPSGAGAELGHMTIDAQGNLCGCGTYGCLETFASDSGIRTFIEKKLEEQPESLLANYHPENLNFKAVNECRLKSDPLALETYGRVVNALGIGIANFVNIFNPQAVILSGGMIKAGSDFIDEVDVIVRERSFDVLNTSYQLLTSTLGDNTGVLGAAACAFSS